MKTSKLRSWTVPLAVCALVISTAHAAAPSQDATFQRLVTVCGEMPDASQRVACFDREIAPFRERNASAATRPESAPRPPVAQRPQPPAPAASAPSATSPTPPRAQAPSAQGLGAEQLAKPSSRADKTEDVAQTARITQLRVIDPTASLVTLDNGQVWRNEDPRRSGYLAEGDSVTIRKGSFGSYRLTKDGEDSRNWISVTRVR